MSTATTAVEHVRDEIVLSANELRDAHRIAAQSPSRAMTYLAECEHDGYVVAPRTRAKYMEAARFVISCGLLPVYDTDKPEPTVTARTTERVLPAIQTDVDGDRFLDGGAYRFTCDEGTGDVIVSVKERMSEHEFAAVVGPLAADADRFARAIKAPVPSSWTRGVA